MVMLTAQSVPLAAEEPSPLLPHTAEIIIGLVAFGVLYYFLRKYVLPVFERTYAERTAAIEGGIKQAEQAQAEAQRTLEEYRAQLADAREEAARIRDAYQCPDCNGENIRRWRVNKRPCPKCGRRMERSEEDVICRD
jgi:F-type H+-transporting ATPase subunit b